MAVYKFVFFDLDGTLVDTNDSCWAEIKFGREGFDARHVPLLKGARLVISSLIESGLEVWLVSDAAESYVRKLALHIGFEDRYPSNFGLANKHHPIG